jgi:MauM/NapG family ferredoxin protein
MNIQRIVQGVSLALFVLALLCAGNPRLAMVPVDGFLRMDPIVFVGTLAAAREFVPVLWIAGLVLVLSLFMGRFFCAYICPMGTTIDCTDHFLRNRRNSRRERSTRSKLGNQSPTPPPLKPVKYYVLFFILGAGVLGVSFVFLASPLSLITRFYGLIIYPILSFLADLGLDVLRPAADKLNLTSIAYAAVKVPRYNLQWVTIIILFAIFACGVWSPRFWCRHLCPSGALFAIFSFRPLMRRHVSQDCTHCGLCISKCPMGAIGNGVENNGTENPYLTMHGECIACLACVRVCPPQAVSFASGRKPAPNEPAHQARPPEKISVERRRLLGAGLSGAAAAIVTFTGLTSPRSEPGPGNFVHPAAIRPPGAIPEHDFLTRCIRCGECMRACPTNTLQPLGFEAGLTAFFSPVVTPRRGPCEPNCNNCGRVCPTSAIPHLHIAEKQKARVGTARIFRQKCLAWELDKKCLICDEVCPYDAVEFRKLPGMRIVAPFVNESKCYGCGFCEYYCPEPWIEEVADQVSM